MTSFLYNPDTPLAFLPTHEAEQLSSATYVLAGTLGILVWDILDNIPEDFGVLRQRGNMLSFLTYCIARLGSLAFVLANAIYQTAPVGHCSKYEKAVAALYIVAFPATSLLFLFRLRNVLRNNNVAIGFIVLWLAALGGCVTFVVGVTGSNIGTTAYCITSDMKSYIIPSAILPLVNDLCIFLAVSYGVIASTRAQRNKKTDIMVSLREFWHSFSREGQISYFLTVVINLITVIVLCVTSFPIAIRGIFTVINVALTNILVCRVFRTARPVPMKELSTTSSENIVFRMGAVRVGTIPGQPNRPQHSAHDGFPASPRGNPQDELDKSNDNKNATFIWVETGVVQT